MKSILLIITLFATLSTWASPSAYQLPITRNGKTRSRVAYNFWSGEYPGPVVDVTESTQIQAYKSLRTLDKPVACTIKEGLYHPWSETGNSVIVYYTLAAVNSYSVTQPFTSNEANPASDPMISGLDFEKGDLIVNVFYLSEGWCRGTHRKASGEKQDIDFFCDEITANENIFVVQEDWDYREQWMYLSCQEGYKAFVEDQGLLAEPKVKEGVLLGYGEVGKAN